ncbi:hypothetical protein L1887_41824 [Cichorium endivia]|nr:hypothetical protein L1887_41824 [Cichorium endivia]
MFIYIPLPFTSLSTHLHFDTFLLIKQSEPFSLNKSTNQRYISTQLPYHYKLPKWPSVQFSILSNFKKTHLYIFLMSICPLHHQFYP